MIQGWTINILIMPSRGRTEKSKNGQKHHRTKAPKDQHQGGQNPQKWENILRLQQSMCTIPWSHDTGVDNQHSRHGPATWWHYENVDCPHLYHVIMGSYTLIVGVLKYFLNFGGFVRLDADPLELSSCGAFVHFCFSLSIHVMAWRECWLSTPVSCDHGIVHLDCWTLKIFSQFWGFCPPWCWSFGAFVLWCFCPFLLFFVHPCDGMTRMLIVHTCIMWSWDRTPWLLES